MCALSTILFVIFSIFYFLTGIQFITDTSSDFDMLTVDIQMSWSAILIAAYLIILFIFLHMRHRHHFRYVKHQHRYQHVKKKFFHPELFFIPIVIIIFVISVRTFSSKEAIPDSLQEFKEKYPEATEFVDNYPNRDINPKIDISNEIHAGTIPLFIQWDKRWGYEQYGDDFFAVTGCGPTCMSMVVCGLTDTSDWTPLKIAEFSEQNGYYVNGVGTSWDLMTAGAEKLGLHVEIGTVSKDYICQNLSESTPMICSMYPGDFTYTGHFIVLRGVDRDGKIILNDPNSPKHSRKHWDLDTLLPQIRYIWKYSK